MKREALLKDLHITNKYQIDPDIQQFRSATISGLYVNPFEEYRPQTMFEFLAVRILEFIESIYGSQVEVHKKVHIPPNETHEIEEVLKSFPPSLETYRKNSQILQQCLASSKYFTSSSYKDIRDTMLFTWLGQSCSLIQIGGVNFLTDPIMGKHLISKHFGPARFLPSPLSLENIRHATNNHLSFVLVSHDHPDHLEMDFAKQLGNEPLWIVPMGLRTKLARKGIHRIVEMDWWDSLDITKYVGLEDSGDKFEIVCLPSMHWSGRYVYDSNTSLWCSFMIRRNGQSIVYHGGDTGYCKELFDAIGKKLSPVFLTMLPIGQYCPSWHQKPRHISPEEALTIHKQLGGKFMMGVHWGTFKLSSEPIMEPKTKLEELSEQQEHNLDCKSHIAPHHGLTYQYDLVKGTRQELEGDI
ncbi:uncharacterized protein KQ657_004450 [Scheffersomyces spartinae]|uniref:Metallo-beta-lactamase domain-containing protein n=1 Tax=Scheffersomyces spartinae TaxID=45513 RepID=A0A9P7VBP1_9ASCO|nr:uncharacterized protein KQ657_004450 [Scheffersomyces spartinae]KAG7194770.1 hypothetical protein KQ657_004450 [Scheffersomyces spartinae]